MNRDGAAVSYDPEGMKRAYDKLEHGRSKMAAMRSAIAAADAQEDTPYRIYFRLQLCRESTFYGDGLDMMVIFPEMLAIIDKYPDTPTTVFNSEYIDSMDHILWVYKWLLEECENFYQVPMADCLRFFEDFKKRSLAYGYNLRPYYYYRYFFYENIGRNVAEEAFHKFEEIPRDGNCDCEACERNTIVNFYLKRGDLERAAELAQDIEDFTLTCGHEDRGAWLRLKKHYMEYYLDKKEFAEAEKYCRIMERYMTQDSEYQRWDDFLYCYAHTNMGKALQIYKAHWKDWQENRAPSEIFSMSKNIACFFKKLQEQRTNKTIKLSLDASFPLYQESGQYRMDALYDYYYGRALEMARRFDARNASDYYCRRLEKAFA